MLCCFGCGCQEEEEEKKKKKKKSIYLTSELLLTPGTELLAWLLYMSITSWIALIKFLSVGPRMGTAVWRKYGRREQGGSDRACVKS